MDSEDELPRAGIIVPENSGSSDTMNTLAHAVLDEVLYNVIHDIVLKTHRDEKIARANTAAIEIEQLAATAIPDYPHSSKVSRPPQVLETPAARYEDGEVYIKGNPLLSIFSLRCPKCGLPRLLEPTSGIGSQPYNEDIEYCKRHPYITQHDHDIYGIPFPVEDSKAPKKNAKNKLGTTSQQSSQNNSLDASSFDLRDTPPATTNGRPSFPTTKCVRCSRYIPVRDFRKHLMACMGISSRSSGRAAVLSQNKSITSAMTAGSNNASQSGGTPSVSRKGTPVLGGSFDLGAVALNATEKPPAKVSPTKRRRNTYDEGLLSDSGSSAGEDDSEFEADSSPRKKLKKTTSVAAVPPPSNILSAREKMLGVGRGNGRIKLVEKKKWKSGNVTLVGSNGKAIGLPGSKLNGIGSSEMKRSMSGGSCHGASRGALGLPMKRSGSNDVKKLGSRPAAPSIGHSVPVGSGGGVAAPVKKHTEKESRLKRDISDDSSLTVSSPG